MTRTRLVLVVSGVVGFAVSANAQTPTFSKDVDANPTADKALANVKKQASIVAIQPSTGAILAGANSPSAPFDIALQGQYPAGSTFKIVTATALLEKHRVA